MGYSKQSLNERDTVYMLITDRFFDGDSSNNGVLGEEYRPETSATTKGETGPG